MATTRGEFKAAQWALLILAVLFSALIVGVLAQLIDRDSDADVVALADDTVAVISRSDAILVAANELEPTLELFPQRAPVGRPLEVRAEGEGCRAGGGVLSIYRLADAGRAAQTSRLVVREQVIVHPTGIWRATPLIAEPLSGSYRVSMTCDRVDQRDLALRVDGDGPVDPVGRRDQITVSNVLVVSGPATAGPSVDLIPRRDLPEPSVITVPTDEQDPVAAEEVVIQGFDCDGRVEGRIVSTDTSAVLKTFRAVPDASGEWEVAVILSEEISASRYRIEADCIEDPSTPEATTTTRPQEGDPDDPPPPVTTEPEYNG